MEKRRLGQKDRREGVSEKEKCKNVLMKRYKVKKRRKRGGKIIGGK